MPSVAYAELVASLHRTHLLYTMADLLAWDEQVNLPSASAGQRAEQSALMAEIHHGTEGDPRVGQLLVELEATSDSLTDDQRAVVREARRNYDRAVRLPADFVREKASHSSRAFHAWAEARAKDDFPGFAPFIEKHLELARREASLQGWDGSAYDYFIDQNDPGLTAAAIAPLFSELKAELVPFVRAIRESPMKARTDIFRGFPIGEQRVFLREVTERLGFDYSRGRVDVSLHPFCAGTGSDTRLTTRFNEDQPLDSLFSAIHEAGHGLYEQGLPPEHAGTALGQHAGMAVHESQSRIWENQVARGEAFWRYFEPRFRERFRNQTAGVASEELFLAINAVEATPIRVDADEVTYNLHIILRFELEQRLFSGDLAVRDLPAAWAHSSRELLGLTPPDDRAGALQDVHWSGGSFGYFPSYCLGNMMAAQFWYHALAKVGGLERAFEQGDFSPLLNWLRTEVHRRARRLPPLSLVREVTGEELSPKYLMRYLRERYGALYGV